MEEDEGGERGKTNDEVKGVGRIIEPGERFGGGRILIQDKLSSSQHSNLYTMAPDCQNLLLYTFH